MNNQQQSIYSTPWVANDIFYTKTVSLNLVGYGFYRHQKCSLQAWPSVGRDARKHTRLRQPQVNEASRASAIDLPSVPPHHHVLPQLRGACANDPVPFRNSAHAHFTPRVFWFYGAWCSLGGATASPRTTDSLTSYGVTWPTFKRRKYDQCPTYLIHSCAYYIALWNVWGRLHQQVVPVPNHHGTVTAGGTAVFLTPHPCTVTWARSIQFTPAHRTISQQS